MIRYISPKATIVEFYAESIMNSGSLIQIEKSYNKTDVADTQQKTSNDIWSDL